MKKPKRKKAKPVLGWAGFMNGELMTSTGPYGVAVVLLYTSEDRARHACADVRRVKITEVKK